MSIEPAAPGQSAVVVMSERLGTPTADERGRIESTGAELRRAPLWTLDEIVAGARDADIALIGAAEPFDAGALASLPGCRAVVRRGVGVDNVDVDAATRLGILVANVPDASVEEVSDHALALLLALERRIVPLDRAVHDGVWQRDPRDIAAVRAGMRRLSELTLGVVGFGRIGRAAVRKALPLYARILVADPVVGPAAVEDAGAMLVSTDELFEAAEHITLHAPLLPSTRHLVNDDTLGRVRPGSVLVNTSRGGLLDEPALIRAVSDGRLATAGLDVTEHEPLAPDDPLLSCPNVVLTAHSAASSATAQAELARRSVDAVVAILEGRLPDSVVNPDVLTRQDLRTAGWSSHSSS